MYETGCETNAETKWGRSVEGVDAVVHLAARVRLMHDTAVDPLAVFRA
jgi:hypothetical protein